MARMNKQALTLQQKQKGEWRERGGGRGELEEKRKLKKMFE